MREPLEGHHRTLTDVVALSLIMVGATPGGTTSNLFTYYARGDVALSVSMTVASTCAAVVLMPLAIAVYASAYISNDLQIPLSNVVITLILVLVPVAIGMFVLSRSEKAGKRLEKTGSIMGIVLILALIAKFFIENANLLGETSINIYLAAILLGVCGYIAGYLLSKIVGLPERIARTVSLETGIQNTPLTIAVIILSFPIGSQQDALLLLPAFYAVFVVMTSTVTALWFRSRPLPA